MRKHPYQLLGLTVLAVMLIAGVAGFTAIQTGHLPPFPWTIVSGALGILAGAGGLVLGFAHTTQI